ncbi:MAG TPA: hypothetical protein PLI57_02260, partial [Spirochaetota bacterium]|nr:hypothetical protein [Spirochaetota bacterium]
TSVIISVFDRKTYLNNISDVYRLKIATSALRDKKFANGIILKNVYFIFIRRKYSSEDLFFFKI